MSIAIAGMLYFSNTAFASPVDGSSSFSGDNTGLYPSQWRTCIFDNSGSFLGEYDGFVWTITPTSPITLTNGHYLISGAREHDYPCQSTYQGTIDNIYNSFGSNPVTDFFYFQDGLFYTTLPTPPSTISPLAGLSLFSTSTTDNFNGQVASGISSLVGNSWILLTVPLFIWFAFWFMKKFQDTVNSVLGKDKKESEKIPKGYKKSKIFGYEPIEKKEKNTDIIPEKVNLYGVSESEQKKVDAEIDRKLKHGV